MKPTGLDERIRPGVPMFAVIEQQFVGRQDRHPFEIGREFGRIVAGEQKRLGQLRDRRARRRSPAKATR